MQPIEISLERVVNTGDYNSVRMGIKITVEAGDDPAEVATWAGAFLDAHLPSRRPQANAAAPPEQPVVGNSGDEPRRSAPTGNAPTAQDKDKPGSSSERQRKAIYAIARQKYGYNDDETNERLHESWNVANAAQLSMRDASKVIAWLNGEEVHS
jgi:hypothetical protein